MKCLYCDNEAKPNNILCSLHLKKTLSTIGICDNSLFVQTGEKGVDIVNNQGKYILNINKEKADILLGNDENIAQVHAFSQSMPCDRKVIIEPLSSSFSNKNIAITLEIKSS